MNRIILLLWLVTPAAWAQTILKRSDLRWITITNIEVLHSYTNSRPVATNVVFGSNGVFVATTAKSGVILTTPDFTTNMIAGLIESGELCRVRGHCFNNHYSLADHKSGRTCGQCGLKQLLYVKQ